MPTIFPGDVLTDTIYNPTGNPRFTQPDRSDVDDWGVIDLVTNDNLDPEPGNIKPDFYGWFDRLELTVSSGRILSYNETRVRKSDNSVSVLSAGNVVIPANSSQYVYVTDTPSLAVVAGATLPNVCAPLAWVTTDANNVIALEDLRDQTCEAIRVVTLPSVQAPWSPGDAKTSFRSTPEPGWLEADGRSLSRLEYPALFNAISYTHGGSGNNFNLPDCRGRMLTGAGTGSGLSSRVVGAKGGAEQVRLTVTEMPAHSHGVTTTPHSHVLDIEDHAHEALTSPHTHSTSESPHNHQGLYNRASLEGQGGGGIQRGGDELSTAPSASGFPIAQLINAAVTGLSIIAATVGITVRPAKLKGMAAAATQSVQVNLQGGGGFHENMSPYIVARIYIRVV